MSPAALRRTYVQQLYKAEGDLRYVQQQAGYASRRSIAKHVKVNRDPDNADGDCVKTPERTPTGPRAADLLHTPTCEACGTILANGRGERIESGQLLCDGCLKYFHRA
ncbi:MAG TPA: hypothetical protein VMW24_06365 [Sedimentisphaerales bacterium]|nr:hypothetical protein [Sedimentisphaerales bacterium]